MHGYGGVEQLFYESCEPPKITEPDEVIVKLKAAAINHIDIWNRMGATGMVVRDAAYSRRRRRGVVAEVGAKVDNVKVGDAVCLYPSDRLRRSVNFVAPIAISCVSGLRVLGERLEGTYAEYVKLPAAKLFSDPRRLFISRSRGVSVGVHHGVAHGDHQCRAQAGRNDADHRHRRRRGERGAASRQTNRRAGHRHLGQR